MKFLIVEDSVDLREGIVEFFELKSSGTITIDQAGTGSEGLEYLNNNSYDLVFLDIMLPEMSGFDICRNVRSKSDCPIIFLTSLGNEENILKGYELGGDDYVVKPFNVKEFYCKCEAMVKRYQGRQEKRDVKIYKCGPIELNTFSMEVRVDGEIKYLSPKEYFILKLLMENPNRVFSRSSLIDLVWEEGFDGVDRVVDNQIKKLRKSLGRGGDLIVTVFGRGYKIS